MKGFIEEGVLPTVLRDLYVGRKTGFLHFSRGGERRSVYFAGGTLLHGDTNVREERLGETLVRQGLLTEADLKRATGFMLRDKKRLGAVLVELGVLDADRLDDALAVHVRELLLQVLKWSEGEYEFEAKEAAGLEPGFALKLSTGEVILEAVRRIEDRDVIRYALGDIDRILGLSTDPLLRFQKITLSPTDGYILSRIDGTLSAREVMQVIPMVPEDTIKGLFGLLCTGIIEYLPLPPKTPMPEFHPAPKSVPLEPLREAVPSVQPPPAPAPVVKAPPSVSALTPEQDARRKEVVETFEGLAAKNHFEALGIPRTSGEAQVKEAYFKLARRFHPDTHHDPALADLRDKIEAIFMRLAEAYEVLRNPRIRARYESQLRPAETDPKPAPALDAAQEARLAALAIRRAARSIAEEKYWEAIQMLEPAILRAEGRDRQEGRILLARAYLRNVNWVKQGEELLLNLLTEDPHNVEAYVLLGQVYRDRGLRARATTMLRKALELAPDRREVREQLAELGWVEGERGRPGGLLKRLFPRG